MVESIPFTVASSLINRLGSAALVEFGRIYGVMDELERLKSTVESIRAVLLDAEEKQEAKNNTVLNWVKRLNEVLHPADDLLDEFVIEDMRHKMDGAHQNRVTKVLHSLSPYTISFRSKMAHEIENLQKKFDDVVKDMSGLSLNPNVVVVQQINSVRRETSSRVIESDITGRENDKKAVISLLRQPNENQNVSLVSIVGIGGLGKTALAQLVYNDMEVQNLFEKRMWVCVSDNFEVKIILRKMLESLTGETINDSISLDNLQNKLHDILTGKRYLLVLDDIWNESYEKWAQLKTYLMCGAQGSKVVVTTRSRVVAQTMGISVHHVLEGLQKEQSWSLLKKITYFDDTIGENAIIEITGRKIAEKCKGIPLAIRSLGGILQNQSEEREWNKVLHGDFWKLCKDEDSIMPVLKLSYKYLSTQQRQCFAYCSLYPKDWLYEKDDLIQMWMAHGYLECSVEEKCMEDVGNQFVNNFLMKSFFQDANMNLDGDLSWFKMHDLMHDLATQVAGNDFCYLDNEKKTCLGKPVHVSVEFEALCLLESLDTSRLQTLIMLSLSDEMKLDGVEFKIVSNFKFLRVLKLRYFYLKKLSDSIENLKHLRYLELLKCDGLESLPKSIGSLVCLQTIKLYLLGENVVLPTKVVSKLINLRHLEINGLILKDKMSFGFGKLSIQHYEGRMFSKGLSSLTNIVEISLGRSKGFRCLPPLERLPFLKPLELEVIRDLEYIYYQNPILHESFYPSLESLKLSLCFKLRGWVRVGDNLNDNFLLPPFPCLSNLKMRDCPMLTNMPTFPNTERLSFISCDMEILKATVNIAAASTGIPPLSKLKFLEVNDTIVDVKKVPKNWLQNLTSLENLTFFSLSQPQFQVIEIWFEDELNWLPSLQRITFMHCEDLKALPDWICNISSLQHLEVTRCYDLELLPEGIPRLTNLRTLEISGCRLLAKECQTQTSATWSKIAHIPNIIID